MTETRDFESLIRGLDGPAGAAALIRALGLDAAARRLTSAGVRVLGLAEDPAIGSIWQLAERSGLRVILIELTVAPVRTRVLPIAKRVRIADSLRQHLLLFAAPDWRSWSSRRSGSRVSCAISRSNRRRFDGRTSRCCRTW